MIFLSDFYEYEWNSVAKSFIWVRFITFSAAIGAGFCVLCVLLPKEYLVALIFGFVGLLAFVFLFSVRSSKKILYYAGEFELYTVQGVSFQKLKVMPYARVQSTKIRQSYLAQIFGLATFVCYSASGHNKVVVKGIKFRDAIRLHESVTARANKDIIDV